MLRRKLTPRDAPETGSSPEADCVLHNADAAQGNADPEHFLLPIKRPTNRFDRKSLRSLVGTLRLRYAYVT